MITARESSKDIETRCKSIVYQPRKLENTIYQTIQKELESWLDSSAEQIPHFVEEEFRSFLKCGILAYGFARAHCNECGEDALIVFSCKGRGICPSCNTRHMAQIAAHLTDNVFPKLPVRQWVLSFPKRIRYFLHHHSEIVGSVLNIMIAAIESEPESYLQTAPPSLSLSPQERQIMQNTNLCKKKSTQLENLALRD